MMGLLRRLRRTATAAVILPLAFFACGIAPVQVHVNEDDCAHCRMIISDRRYAAQLLTKRGVAYRFDSIECLRAFIAADAVPATERHSVWVTDADVGDGWIRADDAVFLHSPELRTPMGGGLAAYASAAGAERERSRLGGAILTWDELLGSPEPVQDHAQH